MAPCSLTPLVSAHASALRPRLPHRTGHTATFVGGDEIVIFGGMRDGVETYFDLVASVDRDEAAHETAKRNTQNSDAAFFCCSAAFSPL